jgi:hypothetical protein
MTRVISPAPPFTGLTEAEVMAALDDPHPGNPVAVEIARLNRRLHGEFPRPRHRLGYIPDSFLRAKPQTAIEAVAKRLTTETIQQSISSHVP